MVTVLIGHWHRIGKYSSQLENEYFQIQLQKLKSQVSPSFLSGTLQAAVKDIEFAPDNTSRILIQLSKVLRYQLYDSNREYVLLSSEITFLGNYLELEQVKRTGFTYTIQTEGRFLGVLIPPLIFTPFVEYIIYRIEGTLRNLSLSFIKKQGRLSFICEAGWEMAPYIPSKDMEEVRRRLEMLYKGHYFLDIKLIGKSIVICLELQLK
ncbi:MAG: histidine kinase [Tannerellaceae bacterium]|nr:histidine kinase [Tannerellaceae bacterium]